MEGIHHHHHLWKGLGMITEGPPARGGLQVADLLASHNLWRLCV
jgi:hypothetical protein